MLTQDLFPGVELPEHDYGLLETEIRSVLGKHKLQLHDNQVTKVIELYETMIVRHGVMLVGPTGGGKTTVYRCAPPPVCPSSPLFCAVPTNH